MTTERRLERDLPEILGELAMGPYPDYIDDVLATTAQRRQRPAWTFPERWLPMVDVARQPVLAPRMPWRAISLALLIVALLLAAAAVYIGSQTQLPAPFGIARAGLIAYAADGDIYTVDPINGIATAIVSGPETDLGPRFSRDGTHLVFERKVKGDSGPGQLYVARSDGTEPTLITPDPVLLAQEGVGDPWEQYQFSPDGRSVLIAAAVGELPAMLIAQSDGSGVRELSVNIAAHEPTFRPPDGAEILYVSPDRPGISGSGIWAIDPATGDVRPIVLPASNIWDYAQATWSPDGSQVAYIRWGGPGEGLTAHVWVVGADGKGAQQLPEPAGTVWSGNPVWSNDGKRLFIVRGDGPLPTDGRPAIVPADGSGTGTDLPSEGITLGECCLTSVWAPDDATILVTPVDTAGLPLPQVIVDPVAGTIRPAPWTTTSDPTWQRLGD
jgi:Tol biopolymer transport system component